MLEFRFISFFHRLDEYPTELALPALRLSATLLENEDLNVKILSFDLNESYENIALKILRENTKLLAFTGYIWTVDKIRAIIELLREMNFDGDIIIGGPEANNLNYDLWEDISFCIGEGEEILLHWCEERMLNY
ncbi:B12 binding domain protein [compost metagenome]